MLTHTDFETKHSIEFEWISPKAGTGCISLRYLLFFVTYVLNSNQIACGRLELKFFKQRHCGLRTMAF
jgi:hypothetical protein